MPSLNNRLSRIERRTPTPRDPYPAGLTLSETWGILQELGAFLTVYEDPGPAVVIVNPHLADEPDGLDERVRAWLAEVAPAFGVVIAE